MITKITDDFDLNKIADSGQCFRWYKNEDASYRIIARKSCLYIKALEDDNFELDCAEADFENYWRNYFDLQENYQEIRRRIERKRDPFLWMASEHEKGIRILRQDPWEMLITFIISQNKNIPAIRRSVELLAESCGKKLKDARDMDYYGFPSPEDVAGLSEQELLACKLGYRWKYVRSAAEAVKNGDIDLNALKDADEKTTPSALTRLYGVGVKVANCVSLFGLHHIDAFPIDVWINRILKEQYPDGYPYEQYAPFNGVYQQYMFAYYRNNRDKEK